MEKNIPNMDCPTLLLIHEFIKFQMNIHNNKKSKIESRLQKVGSSLGRKIMMKVSKVHSSKTRDTQKILKLFANEFWEFSFGKRGTDIVSMNPTTINFKDKDFELITRVSGENIDETSRFVSLVETFCVSVFESAFEFLDVSADVRMQKMDKYMFVEVECAEA